VTGRLTYASICERLPTAQATLKARADAYAKKLSTKPAVPSIRVAIDVSGWLHRLAAFDRSDEQVAQSVVSHCQTLRTLLCVVTVVFDGDTNSDAKRATNEARAAQAAQASQAPCRTMGQMLAVMNALRRADIPFLVAPVEADHQLAYMLQTGQVDFVVSGDSDLMVHHGMRLLRVGSADKVKGGFWRGCTFVDFVDAANSAAAKGAGLTKLPGLIQQAAEKFASASHAAAELYLAFALVAGNDYLKIEGIGEATATKVVSAFLENAKEASDLKNMTLLRKCLASQYPNAKTKKGAVTTKTLVDARDAFVNGHVFSTVFGDVLPLAAAVERDNAASNSNNSASEALKTADTEAALCARGLRCHWSTCPCTSDKNHRHAELAAASQPFPPYRFVPGSHLTKDEVESDDTPVEDLRAWLSARNFVHSGVNKEQLQKRVRNLYKLEEQRPAAVQLHPRRSLDALLADEAGRELLPQDDITLRDSVTDGPWHTIMGEVYRQAPQLKQEIFDQYFPVAENAKVRTASDHQTIVLQALRGVGLQRLPSGQWAFRCDIRRSMKNEWVPVIALLNVEAQQPPAPPSAPLLQEQQPAPPLQEQQPKQAGGGDRFAENKRRALERRKATQQRKALERHPRQTAPQAIPLQEQPQQQQSSNSSSSSSSSSSNQQQPAPREALPVVTSIAAVWCPCQVGETGHCTHAAQLLRVLVDLPRPQDISQYEAPTSQRCAWRDPGPGLSYDPSQPVAHLAFSNETRRRIKRPRSCRDKSHSRFINPIPPNLRERFNESIREGDFLGHVEALFTPSDSDSDGGETMAAELWHPSRPVHAKTGFMTWLDFKFIEPMALDPAKRLKLSWKEDPEAALAQATTKTKKKKK
jgi:5'-3' exonuclease